MPTATTPMACAVGDVPAESDGGAGEHEHRRDSAGERIDEPELGAVVGGREEDEVRELERRAGRDVRPGARSTSQASDGHGGEDDRGDDERDRGGRLRVLRASEEHVPARVQKRGREREEEGGDRHAASLLRFVSKSAQSAFRRGLRWRHARRSTSPCSPMSSPGGPRRSRRTLRARATRSARPRSSARSGPSSTPRPSSGSKALGVLSRADARAQREEAARLAADLRAVERLQAWVEERLFEAREERDAA